eukprot:364991-Chlamydomonas_euryale.AAC.12
MQPCNCQPFTTPASTRHAACSSTQADENQTLVWDLVLSLHRTHKWPKDTSDSSKCWQTILKEISAVLPPAAAKVCWPCVCGCGGCAGKWKLAK